MGKATGFLEYMRKTGPCRPPKERIGDFKEFHELLPLGEQLSLIHISLKGTGGFPKRDTRKRKWGRTLLQKVYVPICYICYRSENSSSSYVGYGRLPLGISASAWSTARRRDSMAASTWSW